MVEEKSGVEHLLSPYRVLDLTDERGLLCGKMLADLGADVIQVEPPSGNPARNLGPFYQDDVHPEKSLFWWAYARNKRGITCDIQTAEGQDLIKQLAATADFLLESGAPGEMAGLGLGYEDLKAINPRLIYASVKGFGGYGPYSDYKCFEQVAQATSGALSCTGFDDRPPAMHGAGVGDGVDAGPRGRS